MADDQIRAQRDLLLRHLRVFRALGQDVDGDGEHVLVGIGDGGDAALDIFGRREVVKPLSRSAWMAPMAIWS